MHQASKQVRRVVVNGLLFVSLIGLLLAYLAVVGDLPSRVYTLAQQEYLSYNYSRSVSQIAPTWNIVQPGGKVEPTILPGQKSLVCATLAARYEEQGGVSVTVYDLDFYAEYRLAHHGPMTTTVQLFFPFPGNLETLHEVRFLVDGEEPPEAHYSTRGISWQTVLQAGEEHQITIGYRADGANSFAYSLHHNRRSDVDITITVSGLVGSEVLKTSLPPTANEVSDGSETFSWDYTNLIANRDIQLALPTRLSFAQRVAQLQDDFRTLALLAPVLVGFFLVSLAGVLHLSDVRLGLESYLLAGCGLALFYPLLTFLSGLVDVTLAATLALLLVVGLLLVFLSLTTGWRKIRWHAGLLLLIFLGAFSLGILTPWRGLLLTGGGLLLVGVFMVLYARRPPAPEPEPVLPPAEVVPELEPALPPTDVVPEPEPALQPDDDTPEPAGFYCPYCAHALADDYGFCPGCGHDTSRFRYCTGCGHKQFVPVELEPAYCSHCGQLLK
jgi:hypothetical protein